MRILYLTANAQFAEPPEDTAKGPDLSQEYPSMDLWPELERVTNVLFESRCEGRVELEVVPEVKRSDIPRYLGERSVDVLHFSGHGDKDRPLDARLDGETEHRLILMDAEHEGIFGRYVSNDWLREQLDGKGIKLLVLNCCWSAGVAEKLSGVADCIIGTTIALREDLSADFAELLYGGLDRGLTLGEIKQLLEADNRFKDLYVFEQRDDTVLEHSIAPIPEDERDMSPARRILVKRDEFLTMRSSIKGRAAVDGIRIFVAVVVALIGWIVLTQLSQGLDGYKDWMAFEPAAILTVLLGNPIARWVGYIAVLVGTGSMSTMLLSLSLRPPVVIERELATDRIDQIFDWLKGCFDLETKLVKEIGKLEPKDKVTKDA